MIEPFRVKYAAETHYFVPDFIQKSLRKGEFLEVGTHDIVKRSRNTRRDPMDEG